MGLMALWTIDAVAELSQKCNTRINAAVNEGWFQWHDVLKKPTESVKITVRNFHDFNKLIKCSLGNVVLVFDLEKLKTFDQIL